MCAALSATDLFDLALPADARVCGIDEAGRAPLAGPVTAAAVLIAEADIPEGVRDSKLIAEPQRERLFELIIAAAPAYGVGHAAVEEIDALNIHNASLLAMQRAFAAMAKGLREAPAHVLVDGKFVPKLSCAARAIVDGDALVPQISAASIIAKVTRDRLMRKLDAEFPGYGWAQNKGYPTAEHRAALAKRGVTPHHRRSFRPVREVLGFAE